MWNISEATYIPEKDWVSEKTLHSFQEYHEAKDKMIELLKKNKAVYVWHDRAVELHNPLLAMIVTDLYKEEWAKVQAT